MFIISVRFFCTATRRGMHRYRGAHTLALLTFALLTFALLALGCGSNTENAGNIPDAIGRGGATSGGHSDAPTSTASTGGVGTGANATGGVQTERTGTGGAYTGGTDTAGARTGGTDTGGAHTGGTDTAGAHTGGTDTGGAAMGGSSTSTGGAHTSGTGTGVSSTGAGGAGGATASNPCPATGVCAIMPLGDSITDGVGSSAPGGGYRVQLFHDAVQGRKGITFVGSATDPNGPTTLDGKTFPRNHEGHPGYTIDNSSTTSGISPLVDASIATNHPQIILLMIGTNDINQNVDPANTPTRLGALLDKMFNDAPNTLVVVAKITPWMDDGTNASAVEPYNNAIAGVVQTRAASGKHVVLVDMYAPFRANANYKTALMNDYLHPNDAGYVIMGDVWYAAIENYLPTAP